MSGRPGGMNDEVWKFGSGQSRWTQQVDFGCGWGGFLSNVKKAKSYNAVELRKECLNYIKKNKKKINISNNINLLKNKFDLVTMFHVLEHIPHQVNTLKLIHSKLRKNGKIIIEVPHAEDFLILQDLKRKV